MTNGQRHADGGVQALEADAEQLATVHELPERAIGDRLTERQRRILEVIRETVATRGYPPSVREVGDRVGLASPSSVAYQLRVLQERGFLRRDPHRSRAMEILPPDVTARPPTELRRALAADGVKPEPVYVPIIGRIAAGGPILAEEAVDGIFPLPRELVGDGTVFLLRVIGDSMTGAGILDGDWVVVRQQPTAENGEIVAAMIDGEATVKTLRLSGQTVTLLPQNPAYSPIDGSAAVILGKVISVLRHV